ncbi:MAG: hypothetical protein KDA99_26030, partial [Planctomycetales bacterium]|nr:hypothetical protein [Planctomycetales bacterium]
MCAIFGSLLGCLAMGSSQCWGQIIFFGTQSSDFNDPNNWSFPAAFPGQFESYLIQDNHTVIFSGGSTTLGGLTVSHDSFGSLVMTGGELTLLNQVETLEVGRERFPRGKQGDYDNSGFVDGGDFLVWQRQFGQEVFSFGDGADGDESGFVDEGDLTYWRDRIGLRTKGGEVLLTGNATLSTNGAAIGRRTKGYLSVGAAATLNVRGPISAGSTTIRSNDLEVGIYGPAYIAIDNEPGLEAEGIVEVSGAVNANSLLVNAFGGTGDFRLLPGGSVTLNGGVFLSRCDTQFFASRCGLIANPEPLMSSQLSITGSGGSFIVGKHDPNLSPPPGHDP